MLFKLCHISQCNGLELSVGKKKGYPSCCFRILWLVRGTPPRLLFYLSTAISPGLHIRLYKAVYREMP